MNKLLFLLVSCLLFYGCKKNDSPGNPILISKIFEDGLLAYQYTYSLDRKPIRRDYFNTSSGQSVPGGFRIYEYTADGLLSSVTDFNKNNGFNNKYSLQYDLNKRITRMNDLAADNSEQFYYLFDYNADGKLSQYALYNSSTSKKNLEAKFSYVGNQISKIIRTSFLNIMPTMYDSTTFTFTDKTFPPHWSHFETLSFVALPNGDNSLFDMITKGFFRYYVDAPPSKATYTYTEQVYNSTGLPVKQRISFESQYISVNTGTREVTYEYIQ